MKFTEKIGNLFTKEILHNYALCHCISSDFALGKGIAWQFAKMGVKKSLCEQYPKNWQGRGYCLFTEIDGVTIANLVTKERYFHKPTLETLHQALEDLLGQALDKGLDKIAMPRIGCGLDKLHWEDVRTLIMKIFNDTEIEILVKTLNESAE